MKVFAPAVQVGFESFGTDLPEDVSQEDLLKVVADYNADPKVIATAACIVSDKLLSAEEQNSILTAAGDSCSSLYAMEGLYGRVQLFCTQGHAHV